MASRQNTDWLEAFLKYSENSEPPTLFKIWSGVYTIAACLQRKCYLNWATGPLYPNFYIVLCGPGGSRKGTAANYAKGLLRKLGIRLAADSTSRQALIAQIKESHEVTKFTQHSSLNVFSLEFTVFLGFNNQELITDLCDWFDSDDTWTYRTRARGEETINGVWLNIFGCTTPTTLRLALPQNTAGSGLVSRIIFVFGDKKSKIVSYPIRTEQEKFLEQTLIGDLNHIQLMEGEFRFTQAFLKLYIPWYENTCNYPPFKSGPLETYSQRRAIHLLKLSMVFSASRNNAMLIDEIDFNRANELLLKTESLMPFVFEGYGQNPKADIIAQIIRLIKSSPGASVKYTDLMQNFIQDVSAFELESIIQSLVKTGRFRMNFPVDAPPSVAYISPAPRPPEPGAQS